jgi:hypothetical protein
MSLPLLRGLAALCLSALAVTTLALALASPAAAQVAAQPDVFDQLFGADPAAERSGEAADGLALPSLFSGGRMLADALALHDLGPGKGACIVLVPLLGALEVDHRPTADGGFDIVLPEPRRVVAIPGESLLTSESGACLALDRIEALLPFALAHDRVTQRLILTAHAPLPVLMRLEREEAHKRLRPEGALAEYPLLERDPALARLWSADIAAGIAHDPNGTNANLSILASGEVMGLAARGRLALAGSAGLGGGITLSDASAQAALLGPLRARSFALGDVAAPAQPLIAEGMGGRGLVISSRTPWRVDLVDRIALAGPLAEGWIAELWQDERLVAVCREGDAAGSWRFENLPLRTGRNRWVVRLYGPHGEMEEQVFLRMVGPQMNAENAIEYTFGVVEPGMPVIGGAIDGAIAAAPAAFATVDWGVSSALTARLDLRTGSEGAEPAVALGMEGELAGGLWATTLAHSPEGGLAGALRLARRFGTTDIVFDLARHGRERSDPAAPALVRELSEYMALEGQGRIGLGPLSLPWQLRAQSGTLHGGRRRQAVAARLGVPFSEWQASAELGVQRLSDGDEWQGWQGNAALVASAELDGWRLRGGVNAVIESTDKREIGPEIGPEPRSSSQGGLRLGGLRLSAARPMRAGSIALDLDWDADTGAMGAGFSFNRQVGNVGLTGGLAYGSDGWRVGIGMTLGLWRDGPRWNTSRAGISASGAVLARAFVDADGDGLMDAGEEAVEGARFIVGSALRREETDARGQTLLRGLPAGPGVDIETQIASLPDFSLRPARAGDRVELRAGEIRVVPVPLQVTGTIEVLVELQAGENRVPRSGVEVVLKDAQGREAARAVSDFAGYVLFEGLLPGGYSAHVPGRAEARTEVSLATLDRSISLLLPTG